MERISLERVIRKIEVYQFHIVLHMKLRVKITNLQPKNFKNMKNWNFFIISKLIRSKKIPNETMLEWFYLLLRWKGSFGICNQQNFTENSRRLFSFSMTCVVQLISRRIYVVGFMLQTNTFETLRLRWINIEYFPNIICLSYHSFSYLKHFCLVNKALKGIFNDNLFKLCQ